MASNFKIHSLHLLNVQVSKYPLFLTSSVSNFISSSRNLPDFRASITPSSPMNTLHSFSLSSSSSSAPVLVSDSSNERPFIVSYLINSCGLPPELALAKARFVKSNNPEKLDAVLAFFKKYGFTETQVSIIVAKYPQLLLCNPEKTLLPKLEFLSSLDLSNREITDVISTAPFILRRSLEKVVIPCYNLLRDLLESDDKAINVVKRYPMVLALEPEVDNIQILQEAGVPPEIIVVSMTFRHRGYVLAANNYRNIVDKVKEMGFNPSSITFLWAITTMKSMSKSTWENKVQVFKKYGWSDLEVLVAFEKWPKFIVSSEDKINEVMDFLVNQMGVEAATIANFPRIFSMSLKKRIVPRCLIYQVLLEKGLFEERKLSIISLLFITEKQFLNRVIKRYEDEAPELLTLYQKC